MRIGVDIDGVLADFQTDFLKRVERDHAIGIPLSTRYDMTDIMSAHVRDKVMDSLQNDKDFWLSLKALHGTGLFWELCQQHKVKLFTSRPDFVVGPWAPTMWQLVVDWSGKVFGKPVEFTTVVDKDKVQWMEGLDVYIDDNPEVLAEVARRWPKTRLFLRNQPYNLRIDQNLSLKYERVMTFDDFAKVFLNLRVPDYSTNSLNFETSYPNIPIVSLDLGDSSSEGGMWAGIPESDVKFDTFVAAVRATMEGKG